MKLSNALKTPKVVIRFYKACVKGDPRVPAILEEIGRESVPYFQTSLELANAPSLSGLRKWWRVRREYNARVYGVVARHFA